MKRPVSFFAMLFILLFAVIGFIFIVFELDGAAFVFELGLLLAFMLFLAFGMFLAYSGKSAGWGVTAAVLALLLLDVSSIFLITENFGLKYIMTAIFALAGFAVALTAILTAPAKEPDLESYYEKKQYYYPLNEKIKDDVKSELKNEEKISATFTPGKYVASKKGSAFHIAKCDWALRIGRENRVWFNSKEEAEAKGLKADKCVG